MLGNNMLLLFFSTPQKLTCHLKRNHFNKKAVFQPASFRGYSSVFRGVKKNQIFPDYIFDLLHIAVFWDSFDFALGMFGRDLSISSIIKHPEKYHYFQHCLLNILIFSWCLLNVPFTIQHKNNKTPRNNMFKLDFKKQRKKKHQSCGQLEALGTERNFGTVSWNRNAGIPPYYTWKPFCSPILLGRRANQSRYDNYDMYHKSTVNICTVIYIDVICINNLKKMYRI